MVAVYLASPAASEWVGVVGIVLTLAALGCLGMVSTGSRRSLLALLILSGLLVGAGTVYAVAYDPYTCAECIADGNSYWYCRLTCPGGC